MRKWVNSALKSDFSGRMERRAFGMMRELTHGWRNWFQRARTEFVAAARQRPRRVCKASSKRCQRAPAFLKISTRRISHAVRASNLLRFGGRPPHLGSADARQKFQREF